MKSDLHSWTAWEGGECPVIKESYVDIKLRNGRVSEGVVAGRYLWGRPKGEMGEPDWVFENGGDIVAYRESGEMA